jgi:hypothetical protein
VKNLMRALALFALFALLAACQNDQSADAYPTLPLPQVRSEKLPTATATLTPDPATPGLIQPTATTASQVQAWPTLDDESYLILQIDALLDKMERKLNSVDTRLKP